jgi:hypothetical protein
MIVFAYAQGDRRTLRNLLSREVYEGFEATIRERESKGETVESRLSRDSPTNTWCDGQHRVKGSIGHDGSMTGTHQKMHNGTRTRWLLKRNGFKLASAT